MDIRHVGDVECISCGECIDVCPTKAISFKNGGISLLDNEISSQPSAVSSQQDLTNDNISEQENAQISDTLEAKKPKMSIEKKRKIFKTVLYSVMAILLVGSLIYFNFIHKNPGSEDEVVIGTVVEGADILVFDGTNEQNTLNILNVESKGSILFIWNDENVEYLNYFDETCKKFGNKLTVFAIASCDVTIDVESLINSSYGESSIIFGKDAINAETNKTYKETLNGVDGEPLIIVLDKNKAITAQYNTNIELETLSKDIDKVMTGHEVGNKIPGMDIPLYDENGLTENTFNVLNNTGKITIINFWGTWCGPCVAELPHFDQIASEYADSVTVLAVHSNRLSNTATAYINENYPNSNIIFGKDFPNESGKIVDPEVYYTLLGGANNSYPMTVIIDQNGIIAAHYIGSITHEELVSDIEKLLK